MANQNAEPIKLFGTTIAFQGSQLVKQEETLVIQTKPTNHDEQDPTVEKRPDKIIPCPRCKSMETKFCYFNNYNVNQPRHFCKGCQRYWTAGGALRNVPVGAGRRKIKPPGQGGVIGFPDGGYMQYDGSNILHRFELNGMVVGEWHLEVNAAHGGFNHGFPAKRRRSSETC